MRKVLLTIFIFIVLMCSCSNVYDETIISDIKLYDTIWTLPERRVSETSILFPSVIEDENVINFRCKHTTYQLVGTGWQVELTVKYSDDSFYDEVKRLNELCHNSII